VNKKTLKGGGSEILLLLPLKYIKIEPMFAITEIWLYAEKDGW